MLDQVIFYAAYLAGSAICAWLGWTITEALSD